MTACRLHGLWYLPDDERIHVSVLRTVSARSRVAVVHTTAHLSPDLLTTVGGIGATSVERALVDIAPTVIRARLAHIVDDALDRRLVTLSALEVSLSRHGGPGRAGVAALRELLVERGDGLAVTESTFERRYLRFCALRGLPAPMTQQTLRCRDRVFGRVDMLYPDARVIVELDGRRGHAQLVHQDRDRVRDQIAGAAGGWFTARVTWRQLRDDPDGLHERLAAILERRTPVAPGDA